MQTPDEMILKQDSAIDSKMWGQKRVRVGKNGVCHILILYTHIYCKFIKLEQTHPQEIFILFLLPSQSAS